MVKQKDSDVRFAEFTRRAVTYWVSLPIQVTAVLLSRRCRCNFVYVVLMQVDSVDRSVSASTTSIRTWNVYIQPILTVTNSPLVVVTMSPSHRGFTASISAGFSFFPSLRLRRMSNRRVRASHRISANVTRSGESLTRPTAALTATSLQPDKVTTATTTRIIIIGALQCRYCSPFSADIFLKLLCAVL